jgi:hypothetical protein
MRWSRFRGTETGYAGGMERAALGRPIAYPAVAEGSPVYDREGDRVGVVEHVVADKGTDIFDGIVVHTLPGRRLFADADQIAALHERGVLLSVHRDGLHDPGSRREPQADGDQLAALRRAWDWVRGGPE